VHVDAGEVVPGADVIVLCVGTPMSPDLRADFDQLRKALDELMPHLRSGQLLIQRSTVSPGTLKKVVAPFLRSRAPEVADDLLLAACPERIAEGRAMTELYSLPELIGGIDEPSTTAATALFQTLSADKPVRRTDATSAELAKLFTNVYRYVNFALANEFALLCEYHGTDVHEIIDMANRDYPRAAIPPPGPTGGPCLSKDGYFLVEELTLPDFVLVAWKLNDSTPTHIVRRLDAELRRRSSALAGTPVAVLGRAFKRDSDDLRQSPAGRIIEILEREGAQVRAHDPHLAGPSLEQVLAGARALVLATNHSAYDALDPRETAQWMDEPRVAIDCWGVLDRTRFGAAGIDVTTFGVGEPK
jgi:UDP-N-acetyl-D-mannosaminuronic acid dehydrogenase